MARAMAAGAVALVFGATLARAQAPSSGAQATAVSSAAAQAPAAAAPRPRRAANHPPDVWAKTGRLRVYVHRAASRWSPVSLRPDFGALPNRSEVVAQVRVVRAKKGRARRGRILSARTRAEWLPYKGDHALVIGVYPAAWRKSLKHLEVRYLVSAGYIEGAWAELVQVEGGGYKDWGLDSFALTRKGVGFSEEYAGRGKILLYAVNPSPGRRSLNAARGLDFDFGDPGVGRVDFSYRASGVLAGR
ncbi:MAG TPA: hypothetical protein VNK24_06385 [Elusimicrobiota bacterium]|nr:hypothetical protein [Elusimicrobiota bacterium]